MDTNGVQVAFSTTPRVSGSFAWSPAHDAMTFTAGGAGLPGSAMISVDLADSASDAASGQSMFAPYHLSFQTAEGATEIPRN
jgi:hypothetical protein